MRVSLDWLNEYVDISGLTPEIIAEALTNAGLEVESIETVGGQFSGVVVGRVDVVEQHPNADRLRLVTVNLGPAGQNRVVCGAPNVAQGMCIAYAQIGAKVINRKEGGMFELKPATIRGVESTGMICSLEELGLQDQYTAEGDGIWPLTDLVTDADLGQDLKTVLSLKPDTVLEVAPTANRGDLMSVIGVAREVAALFKRPLKLPSAQAPSPAGTSNYQVKLTDTSVCQYYAGAYLVEVQNGESPDWMKQRLLSAGIRSINVVVDITNYVMLEYGQPLHAFDAQKLPEGTIGVRVAKPGEVFTTLDDQARTLTEQSVVVTHNDRPVALAGVMGGQDTEISDTTKSVFLEAAFFPSASNRRSARSVGLRSESSARFERGVDPASTHLAFYRAIALLQELTEASLVSIAQDDHRQLQTQQVPLSSDRIQRILGMTIAESDVEAILTPLGFQLEPQSSSAGDNRQWRVTIPSFRGQDVYREIDLIEEVIRIFGYDRIPYTLPQETAAPALNRRDFLLRQIQRLMAATGLSEVATHSLIGDALLQRTGFSQDPDSTVRVNNSQSIDHTFLRQSLIPNLLEIAKYNQSQGNENCWIFELGRTYVKRRSANEKDSGVEESLYLGGLLTGHPARGVWHKAPETDYFTVKGIVENLLETLLPGQSTRWVAETSMSSMHPGRSAALKLGKQPLGIVGQLHPALQETLKFKAPVYVFELNVEVLWQVLQKKTETLAVESLTAYPSVQRDIAFSAPDQVTHQQVVSAVNQANEPLLRHIELFDQYRGQQLEAGTRSLAYRLTLQSETATLTDKEIDAAMEKIKRQLSSQLPVSFR